MLLTLERTSPVQNIISQMAWDHIYDVSPPCHGNDQHEIVKDMLQHLQMSGPRRHPETPRSTAEVTGRRLGTCLEGFVAVSPPQGQKTQHPEYEQPSPHCLKSIVPPALVTGQRSQPHNHLVIKRQPSLLCSPCDRKAAGLGHWECGPLCKLSNFSGKEFLNHTCSQDQAAMTVYTAPPVAMMTQWVLIMRTGLPETLPSCSRAQETGTRCSRKHPQCFPALSLVIISGRCEKRPLRSISFPQKLFGGSGIHTAPCLAP